MKAETGTRSIRDIIREYATSEKRNLPVFPGVAFELQQLLADDNTSVDQIAKVIGKDQVLAGHVLKLANSALFSGTGAVRTIKDATMRLGLSHVFNLVICISQRNHYKSSNKVLDKFLQISWKHALCAAIGSKWLMEKLGHRAQRDEAFLAGLLHDIGKLVLIKVFEKMNSKNEELVFSDAFISEILVSMHATLGYELLEEWSIPESYCKIALNHHDEEFDKDNHLLMTVRIVNEVCRKSGISTNPEGPSELGLLPEVRALRVSDDILSDLEMVISDITMFGI
ncbi:MAG: HDOD domain-containing protein [Desulfobacteraceae bacterium]|nr:HDOD domain-containing protein [Desulfobacteraceae bacterium]